VRDLAGDGLQGRRLLVVEDDFLIASDLAYSLEQLGAEIIGPAGSVNEALELVETSSERMDAAVLDINLHGLRVYPVADALVRRGVPFVFASGYDGKTIPEPYCQVLRLEKPVDKGLLARSLVKLCAA